jgi:hypothetical protein
MPRTLNDLFEAAVSTAPPERHHAADITHLAERRQRRRTTFVAAAATLGVAVVAGVAVGITQHHPSKPEPAAPAFKYGQELDVNNVVAASSLPGIRELPWTQPSVQHLAGGGISLPNYAGIDASGRLLVQTYRAPGAIELRTVRLYDAPGQPAAPLQPPTSSGATSPGWVPRFTGDGRLWWTSTVVQGPPTGVNTIHVTDLAGGQDVPVRVGSVNGGVRAWVTGDRVWYEGQQKGTAQGIEIRRLYTVPVSGGGSARLVADNVLAADVSDGVAGWVTTDGRVHLASADGSGVREVHVPLDPGCTVTPAPEMSLTEAFAVTRDAVALSERCGTGARQFDDLVAFDPSGRLLVHVKGLSVRAVSLSGASLAVGGIDGGRHFQNLLYDLRTGTLATFGRFQGRLYEGSPTLAGSYLLWYDTSGHVVKLPG